MFEAGDANHNKKISHYISRIRERFSLLIRETLIRDSLARSHASFTVICLDPGFPQILLSRKSDGENSSEHLPRHGVLWSRSPRYIIPKVYVLSETGSFCYFSSHSPFLSITPASDWESYRLVINLNTPLLWFPTQFYGHLFLFTFGRKKNFFTHIKNILLTSLLAVKANVGQIA